VSMAIWYLAEELLKERGLKRIGECKKCGRCCQGAVRMYKYDAVKKEFSFMGVNINRECSGYNKVTKLCTASVKPPICVAFPFLPEVVPEGCGYKFVKI